MNIEARKISLAKKLFSIDKVSILDKLEAFFNQEEADADWYDDLTFEDKKAIARGTADLEAGRVTPHEEVRLGVRKRIESKQNS